MDTVTVGDFVVFLVAGLIIGAIARLLLPGDQPGHWLFTLAVGAIAAVIGGTAWNALLPNNHGSAWIGGVLAAMLMILVYQRIALGSWSCRRRY